MENNNSEQNQTTNPYKIVLSDEIQSDIERIFDLCDLIDEAEDEDAEEDYLHQHSVIQERLVRAFTPHVQTLIDARLLWVFIGGSYTQAKKYLSKKYVHACFVADEILDSDCIAVVAGDMVACQESSYPRKNRKKSQVA